MACCYRCTVLRTVENLGDPEGDLIKAVRAIVGDAIPIVVTLDLHAHVTADMVRFR